VVRNGSGATQGRCLQRSLSAHLARVLPRDRACVGSASGLV